MKYLLVVSFFIGLLLPSFSSAATVEELQALINQLKQQIQQLQAQLAQIQGKLTAWCHDFNVNLKVEMKDAQVEALHIALEKEGFAISQEERSAKYFGESTASAVSGFQQKYKEEILTPLGLQYGTGFVGKATRTKLNALYGCEGKPSSIFTPGFTPAITPPVACIQVITPAKNPQTGKCKEFPTPCDVPRGWQKVDKCPIISSPTPKPIPSPIKACALENEFCGGLADLVCCPGLTCKLDGTYPDAGGKCVKEVVKPSITVLSPNGGEVWEIGKMYEITWKTQGINKVYISLVWTRGGTEQEILRIANGISASLGKYSWQVSSNLTIENLTGPGWKIKIVDYDTPIGGGATQDFSDAPFSIVAAGGGGAIETSKLKQMASILEAAQKILTLMSGMIKSER